MSRIDRIIARIMKPANPGSGQYISSVTSDDLVWLCTAASRIFRNEPVLLKLKPPINVCGDVHGQFPDLIRAFEMGGPLPKKNYLFLGDYVGRGTNSIETISYLFALKVKYPGNIWLLRGNHETEEISRTDGFFQEFLDRRMEDTWYSFTEAFRWLPISAVIGRRIFCVHGGISPELKDIKQIEKLKRPLDVPEVGLLADLLWSDPALDGNGWQENNRGTSVSYGPDVVDSFLKPHKFDLLCRAHEMAMDGFNFPFGDSIQNCVTVFTAPNYCNEYMNCGAIMMVANNMICSFEYLEPNDSEEEDAYD